jgi:hypothetical protein
VYVVPRLYLELGSRKAKIDSANVLMQKIIPNEHFYGNIGQDFISNFDELIYNFKSMYVEGK